jgi:molecular chaperone Hsp33
VVELVARHRLGETAALLAAELAVANLLLSAWVKGQERITLQAKLAWPEATFYGEACSDGTFRGRAAPPDPEWGDGRITGELYAIRFDEHREIYRGITSCDRDPIEHALTRHLARSEQVEAVARIGVRELPDGQWAAQGLVVERMPFERERPRLDPAAWSALREVVRARPFEDLWAEVGGGQFAGGPLVELERTPLVWRCTCSDERVHGMLLGLGAAELDDMIREDGRAEVTCHFCNTRRVVELDALKALRASLDVGAAEA